MKKLVSVVSVSLLFFLTGAHINAGQDKVVYIICKELTKQVLSDVKVSKKKLDNGLRVEMKSKNKAKMDSIRKLIQKYIDVTAALTADSTSRPNELLFLKAVKPTLTDISDGIRLEMVSDDPEMVKIIKDVSIPRTVFRPGSNVGTNAGGEDVIDF